MNSLRLHTRREGQRAGLRFALGEITLHGANPYRSGTVRHEQFARGFRTAASAGAELLR